MSKINSFVAMCAAIVVVCVFMFADTSLGESKFIPTEGSEKVGTIETTGYFTGHIWKKPGLNPEIFN